MTDTKITTSSGLDVTDFSKHTAGDIVGEMSRAVQELDALAKQCVDEGEHKFVDMYLPGPDGNPIAFYGRVCERCNKPVPRRSPVRFSVVLPGNIRDVVLKGKIEC